MSIDNVDGCAIRLNGRAGALSAKTKVQYGDKRFRTEVEKRKACTQLRASMPANPLACTSPGASHRLLIAMFQAPAKRIHKGSARLKALKIVIRCSDRNKLVA